MIRCEDVGSDHSPVLIKIGATINKDVITSPRRWKLKHVNWYKWAKDIERNGNIQPCSAEESYKNIMEQIQNSCEKNIKKTSGKTNSQRCTPWWSAECSRWVAIRRKAKRKAEKFPSMENLIQVQKATAEAKYIIRNSKQKSLKEYIGSLTAETSLNEAWGKIKTNLKL